MKTKGFTLIELLVVIAVIGILVTIVVVAINPAKLIGDSQDARRRSDLQALRTSMQLYYNDYKVYPPETATGEPRCYDNVGAAALDLNSNGGSTKAWITTNAACGSGTTYIKSVPTDPINSGGFQYYYQSQDSQQAYRIVANLYGAADTASTTKCGPINDPADTGGAEVTVTVDGSFQSDYAVCND
ncbi:MAG: hypothetical protein A3F35_02745 [Candidatus Woykebacteria bacterium RIFCSPHIGHO2_12_FULL_45_10]|uniref:Type II secretion system protein GspG C-terminal domain-containing protein n=1 Tax=Candidatus Woykebacteria bacterium RIFCSPHIGHO2_12_FULL_45_10 TaxID=1802603 RepID=A0A1G1WPF2_9BACT|nr:MAG: hypothetical protein A3F35_02745 [Candidatus Woykebacteria bacterium RIFCSPHIGHO2_12_FULL_45_10]